MSGSFFLVDDTPIIAVRYTKKSVAARANGKFGGRPPKEISAARKRLNELDLTWARGELTDEEKKEQEQLYQIVHEWEKKRKPK